MGDSGKTRQVILTVHGRGYRFVAPITECATPVHTDWQGNLTLRVWEPGNSERQGVSLEAHGVLPLQPRDTLRIEVEVNRPAYLYLIWIDAEGKPIPLFPWRPGTWEDGSLREHPLKEVSLPEEGGGWPMEGVSGMETLLLLARETPLPADVSLPTVLDALPCDEGRFLKPRWYENWEPRSREGDRDRGPNVWRTEPVAERAPDRHQVLQQQLAAYFSYSLSVSFPVAGTAQRAE